MLLKRILQCSLPNGFILLADVCLHRAQKKKSVEPAPSTTWFSSLPNGFLNL